MSDAKALAALHARCFETPRPWSEGEFRSLMAGGAVFLVGGGGGFALGQAAGDEAELLTLAVPPEARRQGRGRALLDGFEAEARRRGAARAMLEVSAANTAARALYADAGYAELGRRKGYYRAPDGRRIDALVLGRPLLP